MHGNASAENTNNNAARCLYAFAAAEHIRVCPGATKPLLRTERHEPEIHGLDGLGGVVGLPPADTPEVRARLLSGGETIRALDGMAKAVESTWKGGWGSKTIIVSTGPMTNIALFVKAYGHLLPHVEEFVFMGGGVGQGNRSAVAGKHGFFSSIINRSHPVFTKI